MRTVIRVCLTCGNPFDAPYHNVIKGGGKYCSRACKGIARRGIRPANAKPLITKTCETCGVNFSVPLRRASEARFCSRSCANAWKRTVCGTSHPLYRNGAEDLIPMTCQGCGAVVLRKRKLAPQFKFCSRQCTGKHVSRLWGTRKLISSMETALAEALSREGIVFTQQAKIGRYRVDFAFTDHRVVVEADGDYWHGQRPSQQAADARKDESLTKSDWQVLRLREHEIKADIGACVSRITTLLQVREPQHNGSPGAPVGTAQ